MPPVMARRYGFRDWQPHQGCAGPVEEKQRSLLGGVVVLLRADERLILCGEVGAGVLS